MSKTTALLLVLFSVLPVDRFIPLGLLPVLIRAVLHFHGVLGSSPKHLPLPEQAGTCLMFTNAGSAAIK